MERGCAGVNFDGSGLFGSGLFGNTWGAAEFGTLAALAWVAYMVVGSARRDSGRSRYRR